MNIQDIQPITDSQEQVFSEFDDGQNVMLIGSAGTGKTFISMFLALEELVENETIKKVVIIRSAVPSRDVGFLKGSIEEKLAIYEVPYKTICQELLSRGDIYDTLKKKKELVFESTSFLRGTTFNDSIIIVDEIQNMCDQELHTIITRVGENSRLLMIGDIKQCDLKREKSGFNDFFSIINRMESFSVVNFTTTDIVRSGLVKEYLEIKEGHNDYDNEETT